MNRTFRKRKRTGTSMAEFALCLFVFFLLAFPLIDLIGFICGVASAYLVTYQTASAASVSTSYSDALSTVAREAASMLATGIAKFGKVTPAAASPCGVDLFVESKNIRNGDSSVYGPNLPMPVAVDTNNFLYEYEAIGRFNISPMINLSSMPFVGNITGLGKPIAFSCSVKRAVEHPEGLTGLGNIALFTIGDSSAIALTNNSEQQSDKPLSGVVEDGDTPRFFTAVPVVDEEGNAQVFLMDFLINGGRNQVYFSGTFLSSSTASKIVSHNQFNSGKESGRVSQTQTNPFSNISKLGLGVAGQATHSDYCEFTSQLGERGLTEAQQQASLEGFNSFWNWACATGVVR